MAPHVIDVEIIKLAIPSHGIKSLLGADDGSILGPVPNFEHALTGIAEDRSRTPLRDMFEQRLEQVVYHYLWRL